MAEAEDVNQRATASRRRVVVILVVAALGLVAVVVALLRREGDPSTVQTTATTSAVGGVTPGMASCVEPYDLSKLKNRQVALDGLVKEVDGDHITLKVVHWYRGGTDEEVTLAGASTLAGTTSAGQAVPLEAGTRLLVAGDGGFAWSCGYTQPYDSQTAEKWSKALAG